MKFRTESDSLGKIKVPSDKYWGASTQRSNKYFDIGDFLVRPIVIKSIAMIKKAAAIVNARNGDIDKRISKAIIKAANEIISGKHKDQFPLKVWQTGSGTQTNMNVNEVISNRAIQLFAGTADVVGSFNIGIGAMHLIIRIISDLESAKRVLLGQCVLTGFGLLIALYNHLYMGGGPPIPILVLLFISAILALYGSRKGTI